jgi:hypothetical protein
MCNVLGDYIALNDNIIAMLQQWNQSSGRPTTRSFTIFGYKFVGLVFQINDAMLKVNSSFEECDPRPLSKGSDTRVPENRLGYKE